jgi:hypothetical protein
MNELMSLQDLGDTLDQELRGPSPQLRDRVLTDIGRPPGRAMPRRPRPGFGRRLVITGSLAVALAAALFTASTLRLWGTSPAASAQAAEILRRAAVAAQQQPTLAAGPAQFVYVESLESAAAMTGDASGRITSVHVDTSLYEEWNSASGTRNGLQRMQPRSPSSPGRPAGSWQTTALPGCRNGRPNPAAGAAMALPAGRCVPQPAYQAGLPRSARAMSAYLYRNSHGQNPPAVQAFITAGDLIRGSYVRPAALAALFAAVAQIPGVSVAHHALNAAGQRGVAVQQTYRGISAQLIFNPRTYAFIGERQVAIGASSGLRVGTVLDSTAILRVAVVNQAGEFPRPGGSGTG